MATEMRVHPELTLGSCGSSELNKFKQEFGVILIRNFFTAEQLSGWRLFGNYTYAIGEAICGLAKEEDVPEFLRIGLTPHGWIPWINATEWLKLVGINDSRIIREALGQARETAAAAFGVPQVRLLEQVSTLRRHRSGALVNQVPWHRDSAVVKTSPFGQALNMWIPFVDAGVDTPSLEVIIGSHQVMHGIPEPPEPQLENLTDSWVDENLSGLAKWVPHCRAGDALIFDHDIVHRTQPLPEARAERMSLELRWSPVE